MQHIFYIISSAGMYRFLEWLLRAHSSLWLIFSVKGHSRSVDIESSIKVLAGFCWANTVPDIFLPIPHLPSPKTGEFVGHSQNSLPTKSELPYRFKVTNKRPQHEIRRKVVRNKFFENAAGDSLVHSLKKIFAQSPYILINNIVLQSCAAKHFNHSVSVNIEEMQINDAVSQVVLLILCESVAFRRR